MRQNHHCPYLVIYTLCLNFGVWRMILNSRVNSAWSHFAQEIEIKNRSRISIPGFGLVAIIHANYLFPVVCSDKRQQLRFMMFYGFRAAHVSHDSTWHAFYPLLSRVSFFFFLSFLFCVRLSIHTHPLGKNIVPFWADVFPPQFFSSQYYSRLSSAPVPVTSLYFYRRPFTVCPTFWSLVRATPTTCRVDRPSSARAVYHPLDLCDVTIYEWTCARRARPWKTGTVRTY